MNLADFKTILFDCDGVVLHSNRVKTDAFYKIALPYGPAAAQALVDYHIEKGGVSRYKKLEWFVEKFVIGEKTSHLQRLLQQYGDEVYLGLTTCPVADRLTELRERTKDIKWMIVSGGDQSEIRDIFYNRKILHLFDGGIFGSPDSKNVIIQRELDGCNIDMPAIFIGDSRYDYQTAVCFGLDFIFVSGWTEFRDWESFFSEKDILVIDYLGDLLS